MPHQFAVDDLGHQMRWHCLEIGVGHWFLGGFGHGSGQRLITLLS
jgi:hypothetical protein